MRTICIFFILICLCAGCNGKNRHGIAVKTKDQTATQKEIMERGRIAADAIIKGTFLPETGIQRLEPPKEIKSSGPKELEQPNGPNALIPGKLEESKNLNTPNLQNPPAAPKTTTVK